MKSPISLLKCTYPINFTEEEGNVNKGKLIFEEGTYKGEIKNLTMHGEGESIYKNRDTYDGQWKDVKKEGYGTYTFKHGIYY